MRSSHHRATASLVRLTRSRCLLLAVDHRFALSLGGQTISGQPRPIFSALGGAANVSVESALVLVLDVPLVGVPNGNEELRIELADTAALTAAGLTPIVDGAGNAAAKSAAVSCSFWKAASCSTCMYPGSSVGPSQAVQISRLREWCSMAP